MTLIEAAKLAREALKSWDRQTGEADSLKVWSAIDALDKTIPEENKHDPVALLKSLGPKPWETSEAAHAQAKLILDFEESIITSTPKREWQGLTNEEWRDIVDDPELDHIGAIKTAIEAKLKEKNT